MSVVIYVGFSGGSVVKNLPANAGDVGLIPGSGRFLGEGHGSPLQCSCLGSPVDRGAWWSTVQGIVKIQTWLSTHAATNRNWGHDWGHMLLQIGNFSISLSILSIWEQDLSPIPNLMVAQIYRFPGQGHIHGEGPGSDWWEALEVFICREGWAGVTQWSFCAGFFTLPDVLCHPGQRRLVLHWFESHANIMHFTIGPLKTSLSYVLGFPILLWFSFKDSEWLYH